MSRSFPSVVASWFSSLKDAVRPLWYSPFGWRLVSSYAVLFLVSTLLLIVLTYSLMRGFMRNRDQAHVQAQADAYATINESGGLSALRTEVESDAMNTELLMRLVRPDGTVTYELNRTDLGADELAPLVEGDALAGDGWLRVYENDEETEEDGDAVEIVSQSLPDGTRMQFGLSTEPRDEVMETFRWAVAAVALPMVGLALLGGVLLSLRALRPVRGLVDTVQTIIDTGEVERRVPVGNDHGEFGELAHLVNRMLVRIQTLIERMRETLDDAAHDLRTPLTQLRGRAEMALQSEDPEERQAALADIVASADHIHTLLDTVLTVAEAEAGAMDLHPSPVALPAFVEEVVALYAVVAEEKNLTLTTEVDDATLYVDAERMQQALANVVDNALKYTPEEGQVTVEATATDTEGIFRVHDTGIGIPKVDQPHIWERLYRGDDSRSEEGLGLGLSLVKAVVEAHGGTVAAESTPGRGTTVTLRVPRRPTSFQKCKDPASAG